MTSFSSSYDSKPSQISTITQLLNNGVQLIFNQNDDDRRKIPLLKATQMNKSERYFNLVVGTHTHTHSFSVHTTIIFDKLTNSYSNHNGDRSELTFLRPRRRIGNTYYNWGVMPHQLVLSSHTTVKTTTANQLALEGRSPAQIQTRRMI